MLKNIISVFLVLSIPFFLFSTIWQSMEYSALENEVSRLDKEQYEVISVNRRFISGITVLSTPERIEKIAVEEMGMKKAEAGDIMRIELKESDKGV